MSAPPGNGEGVPKHPQEKFGAGNVSNNKRHAFSAGRMPCRQSERKPYVKRELARMEKALSPDQWRQIERETRQRKATAV
jgi:hypothetical protein